MGKRIVWIVMCVLLVCISAILCMLLIWVVSRADMIRRVDPMLQTTMSMDEYALWLEEQRNPMDDDFTGEILNGDDIAWQDNSAPIENNKNIINILLIGQDRREGQGRQRSDAMILCTINTEKKTITLSSFMRDMYVEIPGYSPNRINASYELGGMPLLDATLEQNFGIQIDGNIEVDFDGFIEVIDMLGGIDIELSRSEASYLNRRGNWDVDDSTAGQWNLTEGLNHLSGEQALAFSRIRYVGNDDFERTERQRRVINRLIEKCRELNVIELDNLLKKILPNVTTDMTNREILEYTTALFPMLSDAKIGMQRFPADGAYTFAYIDGMSVLRVNFKINKEILASVMGDS